MTALVEMKPRWGAVGWAALLVAFAIGFVGFPLRVVGARAEYLPGDDIDNPLNNYILEHGYRYLTGRASAFWDAPMFYPQPTVTAWSDAHIGMLPIYAALRASGLSPERAFQGHFLSTFVLNFFATAWALRRLGFGAWGTASGAYLFAFGLPLVAQVNHAQLFPRFLVPLAVVFAWEFARAPDVRRLAALAACAVGQTYLTVYIGYFLVLVLVTGGALAAIALRHQLPWKEMLKPGRAEWKKRALVFAGAVLASLPLVIGHARGAGSGYHDLVRDLAPKPEAWLTTSATSAVAAETGVSRSERAIGETQLAPGFLTLTALTFGLVRVVRPGALSGTRATAALAALTVVVLVLLVTRFGPVWLYSPIAYLPGVSGMRVVGRVVLVLLFPAGVALAGLVDACVRHAARAGKFAAPLAGVVCLFAVIADHWLASPEGEQAKYWSEMRYPVEHLLVRQQRLETAIRQHPNPKLVYVFPSVAENKRLASLVVQVEAMRAAQNLGLPCVNGWSGYVPHGWNEFKTYRELMDWLTVRHQIPDDELRGLAVVGEPAREGDPLYEAVMRERFPPRLPR